MMLMQPLWWCWLWWWLWWLWWWRWGGRWCWCNQCNVDDYDDEDEEEEDDVDATNVEGNGGDASLFNHMQRWRWWPVAIMIIMMMIKIILMINWIICESQWGDDADEDEEDMTVRDKTCVSLLPLRSSAHTPNRLHSTVKYTAILYSVQYGLQCTSLYTVRYSAICISLRWNALHSCAMHWNGNLDLCYDLNCA